ncbi:MAG: glycosyltransferase family 2 protein [Candidatus Methylacidiphilales bacterium]
MAETVSVVLPLFREGASVLGTLEAVRAFAAKEERFEFIFVDDGSGDDTAALIEGALKERPHDRIHLAVLEQNRGKGAAVARGFALATGQRWIFTDGDLAYPLTDLLRLDKALDQADIAIGTRSDRDGGARAATLRRRVLGEGFNLLVRIVLGLSHADTQAGIKGFRREAAETLFRQRQVDGFAFDVELLFLAKRLALQVAEVPVRPREEHVYKKSKLKLFKDSVEMLRQVATIRGNAFGGRYCG